jgi:hypothetical protein
MKTILIAALVIILIPPAHAQQISFINTAGQLRLETYSSSLTDNNEPHRKLMCNAAKAGLISMGAGLISFYIGAKMIDDHANYAAQTHNGNDQGIGDGIYPALFGILAFGVGTGLGIGGGIHDLINYHKYKLSLIAPRSDELGIAYNF